MLLLFPKANKIPGMNAEDFVVKVGRVLADALNVRAFWLGRGMGPISRFNTTSPDPYDIEKFFSSLGPKERTFALDMLELLVRYRDT